MRGTKALLIMLVLILAGQACLLGGAPRGGGEPVTLPETGGGESTPMTALLTQLAVPPSPAPTETPAPSATPPPPTATVISEPVEAVITAERLNLRQGPGLLFAALGQVGKGTRVSVLGRARGANWVYVDADAEQGWVASAYTSLDNTDVLAALAPIETPEMQTIHGQVLDREGQPVPGVEFAIFQGSEESNPPSARAVTDAEGSFYVYLPAETAGTWRISLSGASCDSLVVDDRCAISGALMPRFTDVTLPVEGTVEFLYER